MMISIGEFFFRYRNQAFPLIIIALFVLAAPSSEIFPSEGLDQGKRHHRCDDCDFRPVACNGYRLCLHQARRPEQKSLCEKPRDGGHVRRLPQSLYVGNMLIYVGIFLLHGHPLIVVAGITLFAFMYQCIVLAERGLPRRRSLAKATGLLRWRTALDSPIQQVCRRHRRHGIQFQACAYQGLFNDCRDLDHLVVGGEVYERLELLPNPMQYDRLSRFLVVSVTAVGMLSPAS